MNVNDYENLISNIIENPDNMANFNTLKEAINKDITELEQKDLKIKELRKQNADLFLKTTQGKKELKPLENQDEEILTPREAFKKEFKSKLYGGYE